MLDCWSYPLDANSFSNRAIEFFFNFLVPTIL
uniref:Uncharacterized protein n=1 Tax=Arundo donax TaxID=35708 RepID=A0A0A9AXM6_ARUDO